MASAPLTYRITVPAVLEDVDAASREELTDIIAPRRAAWYIPPMTDAELEELAAGELDTDDIPVRRLASADLDAVVRIDAASTGRTRKDFYRAKLDRALEDSSVQLSLAAELDGMVVGFLIVTFYYGEFGQPETVAVVEALGVHPEYQGRKVGKALMRQLEMNLRALGVEMDVAVHLGVVSRWNYARGLAGLTRRLRRGDLEDDLGLVVGGAPGR